MNWDDGVVYRAPRISLVGYFRAIVRALLLLSLIVICLVLKVIVRLFEIPIFKEQRPYSPIFTQMVCRGFFRILGMKHKVVGRSFDGWGAAVANHASWIDIFALNSRSRIFFVSKAEVRNWPGIGWLARVTGTIFINRRRADAAKHTEIIAHRLQMGHRLLFFPEGTSTDGRRVLDFRTTLFQPFLELREDDIRIQPVSLEYIAPYGHDERFYGWWGEMSFGGSLLTMLAFAKHGEVIVTYHEPLKVADFSNRKELANTLRARVVSALPFN